MLVHSFGRQFRVIPAEISEGYFLFVVTIHGKKHMIRLNAAFRADTEQWHAFVGDWNGLLIKEYWSDPEIEIWSDASGSWGCGHRYSLKNYTCMYHGKSIEDFRSAIVQT